MSVDSGKKIKVARKSKNYTQQRLAEELGLATGTVQQYELGKRNPPLKTIERIAEILSVSPLDLVGDGDEISIDWIDISGKTTIPMPDYPISIPSAENLERMAPTEQEYYRLRLLADTAPDALKKQLIDNYDKLNKLGQVEAVRRTVELSKLSQYTDPDSKNKPLVLTEVRSDPLIEEDEKTPPQPE